MRFPAEFQWNIVCDTGDGHVVLLEGLPWMVTIHLYEGLAERGHLFGGDEEGC